MKSLSLYQFFFLISFMLLPAALCAQKTSKEYDFRAGATAGVSTSQVSGDNLGGFNQFGLAGGFYTHRAFSSKFSAEVQLLFIQKGSRKAANPEKGDYTTYNLRLNYIEIPLFARYHQGNFRFYGGPSLGALVGNVKEENQNGSLPGTRPFEPWDLSANIGMSYPVSDHFHLDLRAANSILAVRDHAGNATFRLNKGQYNTVVALLLRYRF